MHCTNSKFYRHEGSTSTDHEWCYNLSPSKFGGKQISALLCDVYDNAKGAARSVADDSLHRTTHSTLHG